MKAGDFITLNVPEYQMFTVRKDIQKHGAGQLPRGEERARSVRGVYRGGAFSPRHVNSTTATNDAPQIKPLTEEERQKKLAELRDKMTEKRARKAAEEAKEAKANELIRRKAGKVRTILDPHIALPLLQMTDRTHQSLLTYIDRKPRRSKRI